MTLHFAYGSNMNRALLQRRCPGAEPLGVACLTGWRFIINGDGYASIVPKTGATVHGVLWRLTPRDLAALNAYESLDSGLYRRRILPLRHGKQTVGALAYVGRSRIEGLPKPGYHDAIVLPAARSWALPPPYLAELSRWSMSFRQIGVGCKAGEPR